MVYDSDKHSLKCPKCDGGMEEHQFEDVVIDRCNHCEGIWFDSGELEQLKAIPGSEAVDTGDSSVGAHWDIQEEDIDCPRCGKRMQKSEIPDQPHIWYEYCDDHGLFMDAGEFRDFKKKNWLDFFRSLNKGKR